MEEGTPDPIYPRLPGGRGGIGRERTEQHQRGRLEGAMVEAVWRHGYSETTVGELVALAGVSKTPSTTTSRASRNAFLPPSTRSSPRRAGRSGPPIARRDRPRRAAGESDGHALPMSSADETPAASFVSSPH